MTRLEIARKLADEYGLNLFPLRRASKLPAIKAWNDHATDDPQWFRAWFENKQYNIGVATGPSGLVVVDCDKGAVDGEAEFRKLAGDDPLNTFTVRSPSGGVHFYFRGDLVRNSVRKLGAAIDVRSKGGLVVGPGSKTEKGAYRVENKAPIAPVPAWLREKIEEAYTPEREAVHVDVDLDTPAAVALAQTYLKDAPASIEGQGGNDNAYRTAARVKDFGLSEQRTLDLMLGDWNERCSPPWSEDELLVTISNAYRYGENSPGSASVEHYFDDLDDGAPAPERPKSSELFAPLEPFTFDSIPRRRWVLGNLLMREKLSVLVSPGGTGKSLLAIAAAVSVATGRDLLGMPVYDPGHAVVVNNEDDFDELRRRLAAVMQHHGVDWPELEGRLTLYSGISRRFLIADRNNNGVLVGTNAAKVLTEYARERGATALFIDPFVETHTGDENNNVEVNKIARLYRQIATEADAAVMVIHHTRKPAETSSTGHAGNADSARGASALVNAARLVYTLYSMDKADAKTFGVSDTDRWRYMRIDSGKVNVAPALGASRWFRKESVDVAGEQSPVVLPVTLQPREVEVDAQIVKELFDLLMSTEERRVSLNSAVKALADLPTLAGNGATTIRRRITALLEGGRPHDEWNLNIENDGKVAFVTAEPMEVEE